MTHRARAQGACAAGSWALELQALNQGLPCYWLPLNQSRRTKNARRRKRSVSSPLQQSEHRRPAAAELA
eukprot:scaffold4349_cov258-Pinguiococcus_pyrenoidosus.AAC.1